jgi:hypothetical protein
MKWYTYDVEVFAHDFVIGFKDRDTGRYTHFHNTNENLKEFMSDAAIYCGFNSKSYDQYIIKAVVAGLSPEEVKQVNDWIIAGYQGWQCPLLDGVYFRFNNVDIKNDVRVGLGLKAIEAHLGLNIRESEVDFDLDRPLTQEEIFEVIEYNKADLDATEKLTEIRKDYLRTKLNLGKRADIDDVTALALTNAKLTAKMLKAVYQERTDGRDYVYPPNLDLSIIPKEILDFFDTIHDKSIPDEKLFKTYLDIVIGDMLCRFAWGGVHGSLTGYFEEAKGTRVVQNRDVSSLYPSLIEGYNYLSRNVPDPQLFYDIRKDRIKAKHNGDKQTANDLKLPLNTVSGAQENQYNDLYDPLPTRSLRISGQLFLTMLTMQLLKSCKTIKLLNLNTDGLMYSIDISELPIVDKICSAWEKQTGFELETDDIQKVWIKDVNNLLMVKTNGDVKTVGGYLNYGISVKGAWAINNTMPIVKKALVEYFAHDVPVETTISGSTDIFDFQIITSAGDMYKSTFHLVDGEYLPIQKVNRVYATSDKRYGKLYKLKDGGNYEKFGTLPEHCIIDNDNKLTIDKVDKTFYIKLAKQRINDYMGIKPEKKGRKKMATKKENTSNVQEVSNISELNIWQKLLLVRDEFAQAEVKKTGKNLQLTSKFFELADIVPIARPIFNKYRLLHHTTMTSGKAVMTVIDVDSPDNKIVFELDVQTYEGNKAVTPPQAYGAVVTYYRRYLYMIALDIVEADYLDGNLIPPEVTIPESNTVAPTAHDITQKVLNSEKKVEPSLTDADGQASDLQIKQMKELLKQLKNKHPETEEWIAQIAVDTQGFTIISKAMCENLIIETNSMLNKGDE